MSQLVQSLTDIIRPAVEATGFELWGVEFIRVGRDATLRVFIDHTDGITVDDCAVVSGQISMVLDVEDPIDLAYNLEVSSPGMDRPFFYLEQYEGYHGDEISVQLIAPVDGRRKFIGRLIQVDHELLTFHLDDGQITVAFSQIKKANLVPNFA